MQKLPGLILLTLSATLAVTPQVSADNIPVELRSQTETHPGSGRYHTQVVTEQWQPAETALIVCDVWDLHHCLNAVQRLNDMTPRLNEVLQAARRRGITIIHAPSECMAAYTSHPARKRALNTPKARKFPADITTWCKQIPAEEKVRYPIDQTDGGEDDDPREHAAWAARLQQLGRDPRHPWQRQSDRIAIDAERDYISDRGDEIWSILEHRQIKNVILAGVHTNMCVLGRPFGLRRMVAAGRHAVLLRDLTDTMYNPAREPHVSHFTGTDLIVSYIEQCVCPTITSDQLAGGQPFRFKTDRRPRLVMIIAEDEYETETTLPRFARQHLGHDFSIRYVFGSESERNQLPGLEALNDADVILVSVRRRVLDPEKLELVRRFVAAGKGVVGIRTASHAFSLSKQPPPAGHEAWPEFDAEVLGGNYHGHHKNDLRSLISIIPDAAGHPVLKGLPQTPFPQGGSLYEVSPLAAGTTPLLRGTAAGVAAEPVAWTFLRNNGGRTFYTSLGQKADFENPAFVRLLRNGISWASGQEIPQVPNPR